MIILLGQWFLEALPRYSAEALVALYDSVQGDERDARCLPAPRRPPQRTMLCVLHAPGHARIARAGIAGPTG